MLASSCDVGNLEAIPYDRLTTDRQYQGIRSPQSCRRATTKRRNSLGSHPSVNSLIRKCFSTDILPDTRSHRGTFSHDQIFGNLYQSDRAWVDPITFDGDLSFRYERYLDHLCQVADPDTARYSCLAMWVLDKSTLIFIISLRCLGPE